LDLIGVKSGVRGVRNGREGTQPDQVQDQDQGGETEEGITPQAPVQTGQEVPMIEDSESDIDSEADPIPLVLATVAAQDQDQDHHPVPPVDQSAGN
jgi:hypothetical protein